MDRYNKPKFTTTAHIVAKQKEREEGISSKGISNLKTINEINVVHKAVIMATDLGVRLF
jgi:hypothetical protein